MKAENKMKDTDWRPSSCPVCGHYRAAARHPVCTNLKCVTHPMGERTMIKKEPELYVWIRSDGTVSIIDDPVEIYQSPDFDKAGDYIHRLGEEVEVKISVAVKNKMPTYRENASGYRTPFENRD
jgi:hypothetical protein